MTLWTSDLRRLQTFTFAGKQKTNTSGSYLIHCMLRHLKELFKSVPTKVIYCYGEYQEKFDQLPPNVEMIEGFSDNLSDMVRGSQ